jgi:hypothetical protein
LNTYLFDSDSAGYWWYNNVGEGSPLSVRYCHDSMAPEYGLWYNGGGEPLDPPPTQSP